MKANAIIYCEKCGSDKIELIYKYPNHIHAMPTSKTSCANCGYSSRAMGFLSYGVALDDYLVCYSKKHPVNCPVDEIKRQTVECVKQQIVQSCLFDEKDNIVARKDGYYNFS